MELCTGAAGQKLEWWATGPTKKFDHIFSRLGTVHQRDRRTDGETDRHQATAKTVLIRITSRGNNYQDHAHAWVCSALTYSILQCPGVILGFTGDGAWTHLAANASMDEIRPDPIMEPGTWIIQISPLYEGLCNAYCLYVRLSVSVSRITGRFVVSFR